VTINDIDAALEQLDPQARVMVMFLKSMLEQQQQTIEELNARIEDLTRMLFGKKSEKLPNAKLEAAKKARKDETEEQEAERKRKTRERRKKNRDKKKTLPVEELNIELPANERMCKKCGGERFAKVGEGQVSYRYEYVVEHVVRQRIVREVWACDCDECLLTASPPDQVIDGTSYGPEFYAHTVVAKCADSLPLNRQAKQFQRTGVPISSSTLCDMFHCSAQLLCPIYDRLVALVALMEYVNADETRLKIQEKGGCRVGWVWTFIGGKVIVYAFSNDRSGETPKRILGDSTGSLQVDAYSGYNHVSAPDRRTRAGCWSHARRGVFNALEYAPDKAAQLMDLIGDLYVVEHLAKERDVVGTEAHLTLRQSKSKPAIDKIKTLVSQYKSLYPPKTPMGKALGYISNNWDALIVFLDEPKIAVDNNIAERALRIIALGRHNFLFAGNDRAAQNLAVLQSLVATCIVCGINPQSYLADVLIRIQDTPMSKIDELLPMNWKQLPESDR